MKLSTIFANVLNSSYSCVLQNILNANNNSSFGLYLTLSNNNIVNILYSNNSVNNNIQTSNANNNIITIGSILNGMTYGLEIDYGFKNIVTFTGVIKNIANYGILLYSSGENKIYNATTLNNALGGGLTSGGGNNYLYNCLINESTEVMGDGAKKGTGQTQSYNHDQTPNNHVTFFNYGYIQSFPNTLSNGSGLMWQLNITNAGRDSSYPYRHLLRRIPVYANKLVTVTLWVKKSHATNIVASLNYMGNQVTSGTAVTALATNTTTEQQISLQFTPTVQGWAEVELQAYWGGGSAYIYFDNCQVSQAT